MVGEALIQNDKHCIRVRFEIPAIFPAAALFSDHTHLVHDLGSPYWLASAEEIQQSQVNESSSADMQRRTGPSCHPDKLVIAIIRGRAGSRSLHGLESN